MVLLIFIPFFIDRTIILKVGVYKNSCKKEPIKNHPANSVAHFVSHTHEKRLTERNFSFRKVRIFTFVTTLTIT
jgi:hypothetical protein